MKVFTAFNTGTAAFILLLTGAPLELPLEQEVLPRESMRQETKSVIARTAKRLEENGLQTETASIIATKLFAQDAERTALLLEQIESHSILDLEKSAIDKVLAKRALHRRSIELASYSGILGFVQDTKGRPLYEIEIEAIGLLASKA